MSRPVSRMITSSRDISSRSPHDDHAPHARDLLPRLREWEGVGHSDDVVLPSSSSPAMVWLHSSPYNLKRNFRCRSAVDAAGRHIADKHK